MLINLVCILFIQEPLLMFVRSMEQKPHCLTSGSVTDCSNQNLTYIPKLPNNTEKLVFENNFLDNVTKGTFRNISMPDRMYDLTLASDEIRHISSDSFENFRELKYLDISGNKFRVEEIASILASTKNNVKLKFLKINNMSTELNLDHLLSKINETTLDTLYLMLNGIRNVPKAALFRINTLVLLTLDRNKIAEIELPVMNRLSELRLNHNQLRSLPIFCLKNTGSETVVKNLRVLHLSYNKISVLNSKSFRCLSVLTQLEMKGNLISVLPNEMFLFTPNIEVFNMNLNTGHQARIEPRALWSKSLKSLEIGFDGSAKSIFISIEETFQNLTSLKMLSITHINMLNLTDGEISKLFLPLTRLTTFECYSCHLSQDPKVFLNNKPFLFRVLLQANFIRTVSEYTFQNNTRLKVLNLGMNKLSHLKNSEMSERFLDNLETLDLSGNPYTCDCDLVWFISWLKKKKPVKVKHFPNMYLCTYPGTFRGKQLTDVQFSYRECYPFSTLEWTAMIGGPCLAVLIFVVFILYRNRWNIKHYIYLVRKRKNYIQVDGDNVMYDAFVAYNEEDSLWVRNNLIPILEEQNGLKLCIHERDFQAGVFINDNIVKCMNECRKIILILSNEFLTSGWCLFELKVAHSKHIEDETELVVIMLENIRGRNMNESVKVLLQTTTYLEWTEDRVGKDLFWNKLTDTIKK